MGVGVRGGVGRGGGRGGGVGLGTEGGTELRRRNPFAPCRQKTFTADHMADKFSPLPATPDAASQSINPAAFHPFLRPTLSAATCLQE